MDNLRGQLVLQAWYNGKWNNVEHKDDTKENLEYLESKFWAPENKDLEMRIEKYY
jgi:hypothetical protein